MTYESRIGRFQVKRRIGRGFAGDVHLVFDPDYNREIALKVITSIDPDVLEAETRGAEIQEQLSREVPQIARVYEKGYIQGQFFIAMEYVAGDDLSNLLHVPLPPRRALDFAVQLCTILEACGRVPLQGTRQNERVVHGDIKPQNIRIEAGGRVRLLDFGVAKSVSMSRKFTGNIFGSVPYLSPERLSDNRAGAESDLWSVSVVLYQMLTAELPYDAETEEGLKDQIRHGRLRQPLLPAFLPAQLQPVLARCLERSLAARYPDAATLKEALLGIQLLEVSVTGGRASAATERTFPSLPQPEQREEPPPTVPSKAPTRTPFWSRWIGRLAAAPRAELQQLQDRLRRMRAAVPDRARHFDKAAAGLQEEMEKTSRQIRIASGQVELYKERVGQLDRIAAPLSAVIREAQLVEREAHVLETGFQSLSDVETRSWFESLSRRWTSDLQKIGIEIRRMAELEDDRDQVRKLHEEIRFHGIVLEKLGEADKMLSRLDGSGQADELVRELPHLHEQLRKEGATDAWLARLEILVQPLREVAKQAQDPLEELGKIPALVKELQAWSGQSGELHREVDDIDRRHRSLGFSARRPEVEAVVGEARELRERFVQKARALREGKLAELDQEVKMLAAVAGPQPALEEQLRSLRRRQVESPQDHTGWLDTFEEVRKRFRAAAKSQEGTLGEGLARHVEHLQERLRTLRGMPLSSAVRQESENLEDEIRDLTRHKDDGQTLHRLRRTGEIERCIEQLRQQATDGLKELEERENALLAQHAEFQAASGLAGVEVADLSQRIDALGASASLDAARKAADSLGSELEALRSDFEARCRKILDERMSEAASISQRLDRIGHPFSPPVPPGLAEGTSPQEAAQAVAAAREVARRVQEAAEQAFRTQEEILQDARSALGQDHSGVLGPDERRAAEARRADIDRELADGGGPIDRLERRQRLIEACEPLLGRLHQDQRRARELRDALKQRLENPEVDLRTFCPELTARVVGLVYGIPENPWHWQMVQEQLSDAESLLSRVESQARRLAAEELDWAVQDLWPGGGDPDDSVFAELSRCPSGALPPWPVRQKVLAARDRRSQTRGGLV